MERLPPPRAVLESDGVAPGARAPTVPSSIPSIYGDVGLDIVWLDFEDRGQSGYDSHQLSHFVQAAASAGIDYLARIPVGYTVADRDDGPGAINDGYRPLRIWREITAARTVLVPRGNSIGQLV